MKNNKPAELYIEGMHCVNCATNVKRFLEKKGLEDVKVNYTTGEVTYVQANNGIQISEIKQGIREIGYAIQGDRSNDVRFALSLKDKMWISIAFTLPLLLAHILHVFGIRIFSFMESPWTQFAFALPVYCIGFLHFGKSAWQSLRNGVPNMDVLIFVGATAAMVYSIAGLIIGESNYIFFETAATIFTLVLVGNYMEQKAVRRTTSAIESLAALQPQLARKITWTGEVKETPVSDLMPGDILQVSLGDKIPADGIILEGNAYVDQAFITGESMPVEKITDSSVHAGAIVVKGQFRMEVRASGKEAVLSQIIRLVKDAQQNKPRIQRLADRTSAVFVSVVITIAALTFVLCYFIFNIPLTDAIMRSIAVLVISCPCALGLATPAGSYGGYW